MKHLFTKLRGLWSKPTCTFCGKRTAKSFWRVFGWEYDLKTRQIHCCVKHLDPKYHNVGRGDFETEQEAKNFIITETLCK